MTTRRRMMMAGNVSHVNADGMITDSWDTFINNVKKGKGQQYYNLGNYIPLDLGSHGLLNMEIIAFNPMWPNEDLSGYPNIALFSRELMNDQFDISEQSNGCNMPNGVFDTYRDKIPSFLPEPVKSSIVPIWKNLHTTSTQESCPISLLTSTWTLSQSDFYLLDFGPTYINYYTFVGGPGRLNINLFNWSTRNKMKCANGAGPQCWALFDHSVTKYPWVVTTEGKVDKTARILNVFLPLGFCL